ncbi:hypothetical protein VYU27_001381 [Nannochloropsis oceanica]
MYSIKRRHPKLVDMPDGEPQPFLSVGEPYQDKSDLPERWKGKRMVCGGTPQETFSRLKYPEGEPYVAVPLYIEAESIDTRKAGFGSKDASKRDEFTNFIRTEQYREVLRKELASLKNSKCHWRQQQQIHGHDDKGTTRDLANGASKTFLYDIGRSRTTPFDPKRRRDRYYQRSAPATNGSKPRFSPYRLSSEEIGAGLWQVKSMPPRAAPGSCHKAFMDKSHLKTAI